MKVLLIHNKYRQRGGEDAVFADECEMLARYGHDVHGLTVSNDEIGAGPLAKLGLPAVTVWSRKGYRRVRTALQTHRPAVAHFHNTFPLLSPAAYYAARDAGVPVVQTLHNYRLLCPNALFFRKNKVCEACLGKSPVAGVMHGCYRESRAATAVVAGMQVIHRMLGTWNGLVDVYIALTEFARSKFIEGGLPPERIVVKPNFLNRDPGIGAHDGGYALFVGRLTEEKGVLLLLEASKRLGAGVPLRIVGDGPLAPAVAAAAKAHPWIEWCGSQPKENVLSLMKSARLLVFPSTWYEGFPMVLVESFAVGLPVVSGNLGSMSTLIEPGRNGQHFLPGNAESLAAAVAELWTQPGRLAQMGGQARQDFLDHYTAEANHEQLKEIYHLAVRRAKERT